LAPPGMLEGGECLETDTNHHPTTAGLHRHTQNRTLAYTGGRDVPKVLVIHGIGMNMRGKVQQEIFGTMTLPEYDEQIQKYASELGLEVEIFHSNIEGEVINKIYQAHDGVVDAALINPAGYSTGHPALVTALGQVKFPTIEVHISNPARRGGTSEVARVCRGTVTGFGIFGYYLALRGVRELLAGK
jgi:3-dehydroquinate dehydratase II